MAQRVGRCLNEGSGETVVSVKMPSTRGWTERPRAPLLQLYVGVWGTLSRIGGGCEAGAPALAEPPLGYHPSCSGLLTRGRYPAREQREVGSLTGAVAS